MYLKLIRKLKNRYHLLFCSSGKSWTNVDYLFIRNSQGTEKIFEKMVDNKVSAAYCCQCSWVHATDLTRVPQTHLHWKCAGHDTGQMVLL